jgi:hypothetical protein
VFAVWMMGWHPVQFSLFRSLYNNIHKTKALSTIPKKTLYFNAKSSFSSVFGLYYHNIFDTFIVLLYIFWIPFTLDMVDFKHCLYGFNGYYW